MTDSLTSTPATTNPLAQLRLARQRPVAALLGASAGLVPVGVFELGHYEISSWSPLECPKAIIVYAGLLFSALTVLGWSSDMFGSKAKSIGFTALLEGIMMTADAGWLTGIALGYLVAINAVANGCRLALRDASMRPEPATPIDSASNLARSHGGRLPGDPEVAPAPARSFTGGPTSRHTAAARGRTGYRGPRSARCRHQACGRLRFRSGRRKCLHHWTGRGLQQRRVE